MLGDLSAASVLGGDGVSFGGGGGKVVGNKPAANNNIDHVLSTSVMTDHSAGTTATNGLDGVSGPAGAGDPRVLNLFHSSVVEYSDMCDESIEKIKVIVLRAIKKHVLDRCRKKGVAAADLPWLEREVERTNTCAIAEQIKKEVEVLLPGAHGAWQCVYGRHFAGFVTHETQQFLWLRVGDASVMLWKHG